MIDAVIFSVQKRALIKVLENIQAGVLNLTLPDGGKHRFKGPNSGPEADLSITTRRGLRRIMTDGKMGFCEAFMLGEAASANLPGLIELAVIQNDYVEDRLRFSWLKTLFRQLTHRLRRNSREGSRKNISFHYDLGNSFYAKWLDGSMTYSAAIYEDDQTNLLDAQHAKYRRLAELVDIRPGDRVLEIGCGWGGFAEYVGQHYDAHVTAITISQEQYEFARERVARAGLEDRVAITLMDYRDLDQTYDKIVSIEMFEAVGEAYWPVYFETLSKCLSPGGRAALQVITIDDGIFESYRHDGDFIQHYIFPGGMLPSMEVLQQPINNAGLKLVDAEGFGLHYARTLKEWRERFVQAWPEIVDHGFDSRFRRMWELYLAYCEGGFRGGSIDVKQMLLVRD